MFEKISLKKPALDDSISLDDFNGNSTKLETRLNYTVPVLLEKFLVPNAALTSVGQADWQLHNFHKWYIKFEGDSGGGSVNIRLGSSGSYFCGDSAEYINSSFTEVYRTSGDRISNSVTGLNLSSAQAFTTNSTHYGVVYMCIYGVRCI